MQKRARLRQGRSALVAAALVVVSYAPGASSGAAGHGKAYDPDRPELGRPGDAAEWMHGLRAYPAASVPDSIYATGWAEWASVTQQPALSHTSGASPFALAAPPQWSLIGPTSLDYAGSATPNMGPAAGRLTALAVDPTNANTLYAGFALGGVWKSLDGGATWKSLTDAQPSLATGAIVLDVTSPTTIYVGMGEGNYSGDSYFGLGILKSTDGGTTWTVVGADTFKGLSVARMFSDPNGALYAGTVQGVGGSGAGCTGPQETTRKGLYKSTDGGATWTQLVSGQAVTDFEVDTTATPRRGFLSEYKVGAFRFDESTTPATLTPLAGLPSAASGGPITRIELARSKSNAQVMYAGVGIDTSTTPAMETGRATLYRSLDGGTTWTQIANAPDYCGDQCMYDNVVEVDPTNPATVYLGGSTCSVYKLGNATTAPSFSIVSLTGGATTCGNNWLQQNVHSDVHALVFHPTDANQVFVGSDGGLAKTANGGTSWTRLNTGLSTLQFYDVCVDPNDSTLVVGGLQDNGFVQMPQTGTSLVWRNFQTGDGCTCAMNLGDPTTANRYLLSSTQLGVVQRRTTIGGAAQQSFIGGPNCTGAAPCGDPVAFVAPLTNDPTNPLNTYVVTNKVYRSTTGGTMGSWRAISADLTSGQMITCTSGRTRSDVLTAIAIAPSSAQRIYAGSYTGRVSTTADGGTTWTNVTKAPLPGRFVSGFAIDASKPETVYVSFSGFNALTPSTPGHIFRSTDAGATWARYDGGLDPLDLPINTIRSHPASSDILYAGTDLGVVATGDAGKTWQPLGTGLPSVLVYSLRFHEKTSRVYVATHGRSAWSLQLVPGITAVPSMLTFTTKPGQNPAAQSFDVVNGDIFGSVLQFTAAAAPAGPWLSVTPTSGKAIGATGMPLGVSVDVGTMPIGEYDTSISVGATNATPASITVPVHLSITMSGIAPDAGAGTPEGGQGGSVGAGGGTGTAAGGSTNGAGTTTGSGGSATGSGGSSSVGNPTGANPSPGNEGGCGCRVGQVPRDRRWGGAALLLLASLAAARRRRSE